MLCKDGWFGTDCSIAIPNLANENQGYNIARAYYSGHFLTFDGASYNFQGVGEYILLQASTAGGICIYNLLVD